MPGGAVEQAAAMGAPGPVTAAGRSVRPRKGRGCRSSGPAVSTSVAPVSGSTSRQRLTPPGPSSWTVTVMRWPRRAQGPKHGVLVVTGHPPARRCRPVGRPRPRCAPRRRWPREQANQEPSGDQWAASTGSSLRVRRCGSGAGPVGIPALAWTHSAGTPVRSETKAICWPSAVSVGAQQPQASTRLGQGIEGRRIEHRLAMPRQQRPLSQRGPGRGPALRWARSRDGPAHEMCPLN